MARNFPCFLTAFSAYARDGYVPDRFYDWVGKSILAAAVERKVTLKQGRIHHVPNIYVALVGHPGCGKSTAIDVGTDLIEQMKIQYKPDFRIIPEQATEPALIDMMKDYTERFFVTESISMAQTPGFFYAREASASALQNTCGDFVATMTALYDCPNRWRKKLKMDKDPVDIEAVSMNMLTGATFNYLKTLVNEQSVMGGFASRLIYIVAPERKVREVFYDAEKDIDKKTQQALVEDLAHINRLAGPMKPTDGFKKAWEAWQPTFDQYLIDLRSERIESIMARKGTNLFKVAMLISLSESDALVVTEKHFERALESINDAYKDNVSIIRAAVMADKNNQMGMTQLICEVLSKEPGKKLSRKALQRLTFNGGHDGMLIKGTIDYMIESGLLVPDGLDVSLAIEPDRYL